MRIGYGRKQAVEFYGIGQLQPVYVPVIVQPSPENSSGCMLHRENQQLSSMVESQGTVSVHYPVSIALGGMTSLWRVWRHTPGL